MKCDALTIILGLVVPLILTLIFILPEDIKESYFVLNPSSPTLQTMFLSNYTHLEFWHFFNNLLAYFITILIILYIETDRKMLFIMSILLFIFLPFISSLATIMHKSDLQFSLGFSAIAAGFLGYLLYATYKYVKNDLNANIPNFLFIILDVNVAIYGFSNSNILLGCLSTFLTLVLIYCEKEGLIDLRNKIRLRLEEYKKQGILKLTITSIFVFFWVLYLFWFNELLIFKIGNGAKTNVILHYLGYCFGLFIPLIWDVSVNKIPDIFRKISKKF